MNVDYSIVNCDGIDIQGNMLMELQVHNNLQTEIVSWGFRKRGKKRTCENDGAFTCLICSHALSFVQWNLTCIYISYMLHDAWY